MDFQFQRGELLTHLNKFVYLSDAKRILNQIEIQLKNLQFEIECLPQNKHLLTKQQLKIYKSHILYKNRLLKQKEHLLSKIFELENSIKIDINTEKNTQKG